VIAVNISEVITVDSQVINYGQFICSKMLGSTLLLTNVSHQEHTVEIVVDNESTEYACDEILGPYQRSELPFDYQSGSSIVNSEQQLDCWFIEKPENRELVKSVTVRLAP
jgi:hypothetical protein